ncbi:MAG: hypothetical protein I3I97_02940 [Bifidobacterium thermophilum]|nr:hypothetical protein [Bifidobacterium thermophilum]
MSVEFSDFLAPVTPVAHARATDPETSDEAADTVDVPRAKRAVLLAMSVWERTHGTDGITYGTLIDQARNMARTLGMHTEQSIRSRCSELEKLGYIETVTDPATGLPAIARTPYHRACRLHRLTKRGRDLADRLTSELTT